MRRMATSLVVATMALSATARADGTINPVNPGELSGGGATVGANFKNGADMAVAEINAAGGILGAKIVLRSFDTQSNAGVAKGLALKALDGDIYALLGPGYSGSVKAVAPLVADAQIAEIIGGEAAELTQGGDKYVFRTSFGRQSSMPKVGRSIANVLKAKSVAIAYVNNDFGKGGKEMIEKELAADAVGFTLLWRTSQTINFAQGEFVMLPAFFMLIDEPSIGLSPLMVQETFALRSALRDKGASILMIEQNARSAPMMSDFGLALELGRTRMHDTAKAILDDPRVAQLFLGGASA